MGCILFEVPSKKIVEDEYEWRVELSSQKAGVLPTVNDLPPPPAMPSSADDHLHEDDAMGAQDAGAGDKKRKAAVQLTKGVAKCPRGIWDIGGDSLHEASFPKNELGEAQMRKYLDAVRRTLKTNHGITLVSGEGVVHISPKVSVQWGQLVRRVPEYMRSRFHESKQFSKEVAKEFQKYAPTSDKTTKEFYKFLGQILTLSKPVLPMPEYGQVPPADDLD